MTTPDQNLPGKEKPRRLSTVQLLRLAAWLRDTSADDPDLFVSSDREAIANAAGSKIGTPVSWATIAEVARNCGIDMRPKRAVRPSRERTVASLAVDLILHLAPAFDAGVSCTLTAETVAEFMAAAKAVLK